MSGVCVYAFARAPLKGELGRGAQKERLESLTHGKVAAIFGAVKQKPVVGDAQLLAHDAVIRRLHESLDGVLPVRYGTWEPRSAVLAALETREAAFLEALKTFRGAEQMVLHLFSKGETPKLQPPPVTAKTPGARYLQERFAQHVAARSAPELDSIRDQLDALTRAERVRRGTGELLATIYHLVPRGKLERYRRLIAGAELPARVVLRGPFPPYAFGPEAGT